MRLAFLILLLANLLLYVWGAGYLGERAAGREPERLGTQIRPDAVRLSAPGVARACRQVEDLDDAQLTALRQLFATQTDVRLDSREKTVVAYVVGIPGLESKEFAERKQTELRKLGVNDSRVREDAQHGPWLVVLGQFADSAAAQKFLDELAPRGVRSARLLAHDIPQGRFTARLDWPETLNPAPLPTLARWLEAQNGADAARAAGSPAPHQRDCQTP